MQFRAAVILNVAKSVTILISGDPNCFVFGAEFFAKIGMPIGPLLISEHHVDHVPPLVLCAGMPCVLEWAWALRGPHQFCVVRPLLGGFGRRRIVSPRDVRAFRKCGLLDAWTLEVAS